MRAKGECKLESEPDPGLEGAASGFAVQVAGIIRAAGKIQDRIGGIIGSRARGRLCRGAARRGMVEYVRRIHPDL